MLWQSQIALGKDGSRYYKISDIGRSANPNYPEYDLTF